MKLHPAATKDELIDILLVEDDKFDSLVTQHYLRQGQLNYQLHVVRKGSEAFDFLNQRGRYKHAPPPHLVIVDIGLPDMDGRQILEALNQDPRLDRISTVVLTGQALDGNPIRQFNLYEHAYLNKWINMDDFLSLINAIADFHASSNRSQ